MTDNVTLPGTGQVVGTDDVGGVQYQQVKLMDGTLNSTAAIQGTEANGLEVDVTRIAAGEGNQSQTQDAVIITAYEPSWSITVAEGAQTQTGDPVTLSVVYVLTTAEGNQTQVMDLVQLSSSSEGYRIEVR